MRKESETVEFKQVVSESLKKSIIAFANHKGGTLFIGLSDEGDVIGLDNPDEVALRIQNIIRDSIKPDLTQLINIKNEIMEGKAVIAVEVSRGSSRPYYLAQKGIRPEGVFVRQGASSVPASDAWIRQAIRETDGTTYEVMRSLHQELTFEASTRFFEQQVVPFEARHQIALGLRDIDGVQTNLGLLLSDQCPHTIKIAVFQGRSKSVFRERREFSGSLLGQLEETYRFLEQYNRLHAEIRGLYRVEQLDYPPEALREVLLNCLIHRDYGLGGSTLISIFDDRVEFLTNGGLVQGITLEDILNGLSLTRNERLALVFYRLKLVEAYGTGLEKVMAAYAMSQVKPTFHVTANSFRIVLPNRNDVPISATAQEPSQTYLSSTPLWPQEASNSEQPVAQISDRRVVWISPEDKLFQEALKEGHISRKRAEQVLDVSQTMAGRVLHHMTETGLLKRVGKGMRTVYLPLVEEDVQE